MDDNTLYKLKNWLFDPLEKSLVSYDQGKSGEVMFERLEAMHASLLFHLVNRNGAVLRRDEMMQYVWESKYVDDRTINATVSRLRKILAQQQGNYIKTHPKLGYSFNETIEILPRQISEKVLVEHHEPSKLSKFLVTSIIAGVALTVTSGFALWYILDSDEVVVDNHVKDTSISPVSFMSGHSHSPNLSPDGNRIAYVNWPDVNSVSTVVIQCLGSNKTFHIAPTHEAGSPVWSPSGEHLYYQSYINDECSINKVAIADDFTIGEVEEIANCGTMPFFRNLAVTQDEESLFYTHGNDNFEPLVITKLNLTTKQKTAVTVPLQQHQGDENVALSPDEKHIAYNRALDDGNMNIMVTNLETGEARQLATVPYLNSKITWHSDNQQIYIADKNHDVKAIDIETAETKLVGHFSKDISSPIYHEKSDLYYASFGNKAKTNIELLSLKNDKIKAEQSIKSAFNDFHASAIHQTRAFVSNRSGKDQVWIENNAGTFQISKFSNAFGASNLELSYDLSRLLFIHDSKPFLVDFNKGYESEQIALGQTVKNLRWRCNKSDEIIYIENTGRTNALMLFNLTTQQTTRLSKGITSFNQDCEHENYYASFENTPGIFQLNSAFEADVSQAFFSYETFVSADYWGVNSDGLYYMSGFDELTYHGFSENEYDRDGVANRDTKIPLPNDMWANRIRIMGRSLVVDSVSLEQTFIGEFKGE